MVHFIYFRQARGVKISQFDKDSAANLIMIYRFKYISNDGGGQSKVLEVIFPPSKQVHTLVIKVATVTFEPTTVLPKTSLRR